ncbi:DUF2977 domain-containing protein [Staphylococcus cohnii]|uniref:DUF2977 domain-containing protein n=1 Tax=Staphylococcus cohnii TaxID=29382 RepID=UPI0036C787AE
MEETETVQTVNIKVNENNEIVAYAKVGSVGGFETPADKLPADFFSNFKPSFYLYVDDQIKENENYEPPQVEQHPGITELESLKMLVTQQSAQIAELQSK